MNQGAWRYVKTRIPIVLKNLEKEEKIDYIGRPISSSSATGYHSIHIEELNKFL
jgi:2-oxoglutarate dehydrogenase complex dehydrogenase (E1) component-like enzyme